MSTLTPLSYRPGRRTDPRIADRLERALDGARKIVHVSAGNGAYEPEGLALVAVEPDEDLRAQRPMVSAPAINAQPDALPFEDDSFDAAMSILASDRWGDPRAVLSEMRRVATGPVIVITCDLPHLVGWQREYLTELIAVEAQFSPTAAEMAPMLGRRARIESIHTPIDCEDGFLDAFWARPEALLDDDVRAAQRGWSRAGAAATERMLDNLQSDLLSGVWQENHGHLRNRVDFDGGLRMLVG